MGQIYKITNSINGKCYIGATKDIKTRYQGNWRKNTRNILLKKSLAKHGHDAFTMEILEDNVSEDVLMDREVVDPIEVVEVSTGQKRVFKNKYEVYDTGEWAEQ